MGIKRKKRILLLVNTSAGVGSARGKLYDIIKNLAVRDCEVTAYPILPEQGLDSEQLIAEYGKDYDVVMCCGGDGTLNHVIRGVMNAGLSCPIGYLPSGSTNDFARSIGIPGEVDENCRAVAGDHVFAYDIGKFNSVYFNYVAAFGAFTKVSYSTNQTAKNVLGYPAYILEGLHTLPESIFSRCHLEIEHDGIRERGHYLYGAISNATSVGGISSPVIKKASLNDGLFEVMLIQAPDSIVEVGEILTMLTTGNTDNQYIRTFTASHLQIKALNDVPWTLDGEYGGKPKIVEISVCPRAIRILVP